jgi:hypothetical protein
MYKYLLLALMTVTALPVVAWPAWGGVSGTAAVSGSGPTAAQRAAMKQRMAAMNSQQRAAMQQRMQARRSAMQPCTAALHAAKTAADMVAARKTCRDISKTLSQQDRKH